MLSNSMGTLTWMLIEKEEFVPLNKMCHIAILKKPPRVEHCFPSPYNFQNHSLPSWMMMATYPFLTCLKPASCRKVCSISFPFARHPLCLVSFLSSSFCFLPPSQCHTLSLSPFLWLCASATWSPRRPPWVLHLTMTWVTVQRKRCVPQHRTHFLCVHCFSPKQC